MSKQEKIIKACKDGNILDLKKLLKKSIFSPKVDLNKGFKYGRTPIIYASCSGNVEIVELLINNGANVNISTSSYITPLKEATKNGCYDIAELLIKNGASLQEVRNEIYGGSPLFDAVESRNIRIFELLISNNAFEYLSIHRKHHLLWDIFKTDFFEGLSLLLSIESLPKSKDILICDAVQEGSLKITELLLSLKTNVNTKDKDGNSILDIAVRKGHTRIVELLISNGVDINIQDTIKYTPLHWAINTKKIEIAKLLINAGAELNTTNYKKETPLFTAWENSLSEIINLLIIKGANGNIKVNSSAYLLNYALYFDKLGIAETLIENGANVNVKDDDGKFPLLCCIKWPKDHEKSLRIFKLLISKGADLNAVTEDGQSILSYALENYRYSEAKLLINNGANINFKDKKGKTPFDYAIEYSFNAEVIELLISKGNHKLQQESLDIFLKNAILDSKIEIARLFIKMGANVKSVINTTFENGDTLLINAVWVSNINVVEFLINIGADVNEKNEDNGDTPLHGACRKTRDDIVKEMLNDEIKEANYDAMRREPIGSPSYYEELEKRYGYYQVDKKEKDKRLKIAEILIMNGADMSSINNEGITPQQLAQRNGHLKIIEFLNSLIVKNQNSAL